jgi:hypothetical protein
MEAFNATIKRSYTLGVRHTLPTLFDILEHLMLAVSLDVISDKKTYETLWKPPRLVVVAAAQIDFTTNIIITMSATVIQYINRKKTTCSNADVQKGMCPCPYFQKHGYCKRLHRMTNTHSDKIMLQWRFKFRGNTKRA